MLCTGWAYRQAMETQRTRFAKKQSDQLHSCAVHKTDSTLVAGFMHSIQMFIAVCTDQMQTPSTRLSPRLPNQVKLSCLQIKPNLVQVLDNTKPSVNMTCNADVTGVQVTEEAYLRSF